MKTTYIPRFFANCFLYLIIVLALYFLYSPFNDHPKNKVNSSVQFVYQQF